MKTALMTAMAFLAAVPLFAGDLVFESAETRSTLIELFTSEGCSSCPSADAWVSKWKERPELWKSIVPVVFHVDYWNGLGWPDRFATAANTARQRRYAAAWRSNSVYTPGFVLNGCEWRNWPDRDSLASVPAPANRPRSIDPSTAARALISSLLVIRMSQDSSDSTPEARGELQPGHDWKISLLVAGSPEYRNSSFRSPL